MLSERTKQEIKGMFDRYSDRRSACMAALQAAQKEKGHLTAEDMSEVAALLGINDVKVEEIAAFYTMYNRKPVGRYHIQVCRNLPCSLLGVEHIVEHIERILGIKTGETTGDGKFTLTLVECLGSCSTAPVMQINEDYYENLTAEKVTEIIKGLE